MKPLAITALLAALAVLALAVQTGGASPPGKDIAVYHIGNSLTRCLSVDRLAALFKLAGGNYDHGTQLGGGRALYEHLAKLDANGKPFKHNNLETKPYGDYDNALQRFTFDALVLQAGSRLTDPDPDNEIVTGDLEAVSGFIAYATGANPAKHVGAQRIYIYGAWPGYDSMVVRKDLDADKDGTVSFSEFWVAPYDESQGRALITATSRDFLTKLVAALNERRPGLRYPVRLIPVGDVFAALDKKIRAGQSPGLEQYMMRKTTLIVGGEERPSNFDYYRAARRGNPRARRRPLAGTPLDPDVENYPGFVQSEGIRNVYVDRGHMSAMPHNGDDDGTIGGYIASLTFYAVLTGQSPVGLTAKPWERIDPIADAELVRAVQQTVWDVVSNHPLTGVGKPAAATQPATE